MLPIVVLITTLVIFSAIQLIPADPALVYLGEINPTQEMIEKARHELGLDQPLYVQYFLYIGRIFQGDFGKSILTNRPVLSDLRDHFMATMELTWMAFLIALFCGVSLGITSATRRDSKLIDSGSRVISVVGVGTPVFWLALLLQLVFSGILGLFPMQGRVDQVVHLLYPIRRVTGLYLLDALLAGNWVALGNLFTHVVLPALTLSSRGLAMLSRLTRATMLETLEQDFIRTARAMGLSEKLVIYKYALRNCLVTVITVSGIVLGSLVEGSFLVETVFDWPGLGLYSVNAILYSDYSALMGSIFIITILFVLVNLVVDTMYTFVDPRIRL